MSWQFVNNVNIIDYVNTICVTCVNESDNMKMAEPGGNLDSDFPRDQAVSTIPGSHSSEKGENFKQRPDYVVLCSSVGVPQQYKCT